ELLSRTPQSWSCGMSPSYLYKIVTVGSSAVGKTSIIIRYTTGKFREYYAPTLGADFSVKSMDIENNRVKLQIWDLGSQDFLGHVRAGYYRGSRGVIYMYDVTRPKSLEELWAWKKEVDSQLKGIKTLVVANKTDLDKERKVSREEGEEFAKKFLADYMETSVKLNKGVDDTFTVMAKMLMKNS
ncbi:MAG: Rab family GTPase, partial [Promethearchaeota archaeon]